jgi:hypothetical protein
LRSSAARTAAPALVALVALAIALPAQSQATLSFASRLFADTPYTANIVDADGDGRFEIPGLFNRGTYMASLAASRMGLAPMFRDSDGRARHVRDLRMVDLDNDGDLDLVANAYWCAGEPRDRAQVYWRHDGGGPFEIAPALDGLPPLTGWGETILAADFDDDGYVDVYLPGYTRHDLSAEIPECHGIAAPAAGQSWLLRNRGAAAPAYFELRANTPLTLTFADCGADCGNYWDETRHYARPEGAQAFDFDEDGRVDVFVSGMLFRNRGAMDFERVHPARGTRPLFDEGAAIIDWNHDGYPDLVTVTPWDGVAHLFAWRGGARDASGRIVAGGWQEVTDPRVVGAFVADGFPATYGVTVVDLDNDGHQDVVLGGTAGDKRMRVFRSEGPPTYAFRAEFPTGAQPLPVRRGGVAAGDLNRDGRQDLVFPELLPRTSAILYNTGDAPTSGLINVEVLGGTPAKPLRNQQGRAVRVVPVAAPAGFVYTRFVDGGSGYMAQGPYEVQLASAFTRDHDVEVRFAAGVVRCRVRPPVAVKVYAGGACDAQPPPAAEAIPPSTLQDRIFPILLMLMD